MLYLFLALPTLVFLILPKRFPLYIVIIATMYMFYVWLWVDENFLYDGKAGWKGYSLLMYTLFTAPFYTLTHIATIVYTWRKKEKKIMKAHIVGLILCITNLRAVLANI